MSDSSAPPIDRLRLAEARRLGQSPRSAELTAGVVLLTAAIVVPACLPNLIAAMQALVASGFHGTPGPVSASELLPRGPLREIVTEVGRLLGACAFAALAADMAQVGFVWSPLTPLPNPRRLIDGAGRFVEWATLERAFGLSVKVACGLVGVVLLVGWLLPGTLLMEAPGAWLARGIVLISRGLAIAGGLCLLGGVGDAWLRRKRWTQALQMTDDERRRL